MHSYDYNELLMELHIANSKKNHKLTTSGVPKIILASCFVCQTPTHMRNDFSSDTIQ